MQPTNSADLRRTYQQVFPLPGHGVFKVLDEVSVKVKASKCWLYWGVVVAASLHSCAFCGPHSASSGQVFSNGVLLRGLNPDVAMVFRFALLP